MRIGGPIVRSATLALATVLGLLPGTGVAQDKLPVPAGGDPAMACGQNPDGRAYWIEYAFCNLPVLGPGKAKGLIFWSHGVSGKNVQYKGVAPPVVRRFAEQGWDVVKIDRNNLYETCVTAAGNLLNCWTGGARHVDDLIKRAQEARAQGYGRVIAGGQSFGGAISVEANAKAPDLFYAVLATSPGHGSDAADGSVTRGAYFTLDKTLLDVLAKQRSGRIVVSLPPFDAFSPNRDGDPIWPKARATLQATGRPFVLLGEGSPIWGHGAAATGQFNAWFGPCLFDFLDPSRTPASGETRCAPPSPAPGFLLPVGLKVPQAGAVGTARWLGAWKGAYAIDQRELLIVVEQIDGPSARLIYSVGAGPKHEFDMGFNRYTKARFEDDKIVVNRGNGRTLTLTLSNDGTRIDVQHVSATERLTASLVRQSGPLP